MRKTPPHQAVSFMSVSLMRDTVNSHKARLLSRQAAAEEISKTARRIIRMALANEEWALAMLQEQEQQKTS